MAPALTNNIMLGQLRRTVGIVTQLEWSRLTRSEQEAVDALALHVWWRCRQKRHPALEGEDCIFLTVSHVQRLLRAVGAANTGEKAAAAAITTMQARAWIEDTGKVKKPRRPEQSVARAEHFQVSGAVEPRGRQGFATDPEAFLLVARVSCSRDHKDQKSINPARRIRTLRGRAATPSVSVRISLPSRADHASSETFAAESGLRPVGVFPLGPAMTGGSWTRRTPANRATLPPLPPDLA